MELAGDERSEPVAHWEHARLVWHAEEENARRLATRKALVIGVPLAVVALSSSLAGPAGVVLEGLRTGNGLSIASAVFAGLSMLSLVVVLVVAFPIRRAGWKSNRSSSGNMIPIRSATDPGRTVRDLEEFLELDTADARKDAVVRVLRAADDLNRANERLNLRLQTALEYVFWALLTFLLAGMAYAPGLGIRAGAVESDSGDRRRTGRADECEQVTEKNGSPLPRVTTAVVEIPPRTGARRTVGAARRTRSCSPCWRTSESARTRRPLPT